MKNAHCCVAVLKRGLDMVSAGSLNMDVFLKFCKSVTWDFDSGRSRAWFQGGQTVRMKTNRQLIHAKELCGSRMMMYVVLTRGMPAGRTGMMRCFLRRFYMPKILLSVSPVMVTE